MPTKNHILPIVCAVAAVVLCLAFVAVLRVRQGSPYSLRAVPPDPVSKDALQKWDELELGFAQRQPATESIRLTHDPLWPAYIARASSAPAPAAAEERATVAAKRRFETTTRADVVSNQADAAVLVPPKLLGLMLDRHARAVLQQDGKTRVVQSGDRFGAVHVVDVSAAGVMIELNGRRKLLKMR